MIIDKLMDLGKFCLEHVFSTSFSIWTATVSTYRLPDVSNTLWLFWHVHVPRLLFSSRTQTRRSHARSGNKLLIKEIGLTSHEEGAVSYSLRYFKKNNNNALQNFRNFNDFRLSESSAYRAISFIDSFRFQFNSFLHKSFKIFFRFHGSSL